MKKIAENEKAYYFSHDRSIAFLFQSVPIHPGNIAFNCMLNCDYFLFLKLSIESKNHVLTEFSQKRDWHECMAGMRIRERKKE